MGFASESFQTEIIEIVERHAEQASGQQVSMRASGKGNYVSVTVIIVATGKDQLQRLFQELKANKNVKLVL
jgi:putative lipoic acid-binding regulatory protein